MARYEVTLRDRSTEVVAAADAYQQEGQMTTFFRTESARQVVDTWSTRVASFRTSEVLVIRRFEDDADQMDEMAGADEAGGATVRPMVRSA
jgi:hypothetical protein